MASFIFFLFYLPKLKPSFYLPSHLNFLKHLTTTSVWKLFSFGFTNILCSQFSLFRPSALPWLLPLFSPTLKKPTFVFFVPHSRCFSWYAFNWNDFHNQLSKSGWLPNSSVDDSLILQSTGLCDFWVWMPCENSVLCLPWISHCVAVCALLSFLSRWQ